MKNFLLTAVIAASAAMPVMAGTALPYSETFDTAADFATMTVVDANSDNKTWYHSDYFKSAMIDYSRWMPGATAASWAQSVLR